MISTISFHSKSILEDFNQDFDAQKSDRNRIKSDIFSHFFTGLLMNYERVGAVNRYQH